MQEIQAEFKLREGQGQVFSAVRDYLASRPANEARGIVEAPTGFGKTVIFSEIIKEQVKLNPKLRTLIVVPTVELLSQTTEALRERGYKGKISLATNTRRDENKPGIMLSTYAGLVSRQRAVGSVVRFGLDPDYYDLVVLDEAHHALGEGARRIIEEQFTHAAILGFTATAQYNEKRKLMSLLPDFVAKMNAAEAADQKLIAPFQSIELMVDVDMSSVPVIQGEYETRSLQRVLDATPVNYAIAHWYYEAFGRHGNKVIFNHNTVAHAEHMADVLRSFGLKIVPIHGSLPKPERRGIIAALKNGELDGVTQAKLLGEGFDAPNIDIAMNVGPTLSPLKELQRSGRVMRIDKKRPDKISWIIDCIGYDFRVDPVTYASASGVTGGGWLAASEDQAIAHQEKLSELELTPTITGLIEAVEKINVERKHQIEYVPPPHIEPIELKRGRPPKFDREPRERGDYFVPKQTSAQKRTHEASKRLRARRRLTEDFEEAFAESTNQDKEYERLLENPFIAYILENRSVDETAQAYLLQRALHELAGSIFLSDRSVKERFIEAQEVFKQLRGSAMDIDFLALGRVTTNVFDLDEKLLELKKYGSCNGVDPDLFFPSRGASHVEAKAVCKSCPQIDNCLEYALENNIKQGVWGGKSERQRRKIRGQREGSI